MTFAATNRVLIGVKAEGASTWGQWAAGNILEARYTSETFGQQTNTTISNEVRSDRQTPDIIRTGISAQGGYAGEISYGVASFELALKGLLGAAADFSAPPAAITADISVNATGNKFVTDSTGSGTDFSTVDFAPGKWIRTSGFTNAANNAYFQISARDTGTASAHEITVVGGTVVTEAAASRMIQSSSEMRNGTTLHSVSVEKQFLDLNSGSGLAARVLGYRYGGIQLGLSPEQIATFQLSGQGGRVTDTNNVDFGASGITPDFTTLETVTAAAANEVMNTVDGIGQLILNRAAPFTGVTVSDLSVSLNSALRNQTQVGGGLGLAGIGVGRFTIGGSLTAYFEDTQLLEQHLRYQDTDLAVVTKDGANNAYLWDLGAIKLGGDGLPKGAGNDQDAVISLDLAGKRSTSYGLDYMAGVHKFAA